MDDVADRPFALPLDSVEFTLELPVPPSINQCRKITLLGRQLLKHWHRDADAHLMVSMNVRRPLPVGQISGHCEAVIELSEDATGIDLDNCLKAVLDYAVSRGFLPDDSPKFVRQIVLRWSTGGPGVKLTLRSLHG